MITPTAPVHEPPPIPGVRRSRMSARGVDFHVTEAGDPDGLPVLLLHGWPQHHYAWRHLLSEPPPGLRLIAPDLPGYGWSAPPPHRWFKREIARDVMALMDALELERVLLMGHDWGGVIGYLMVLDAPERFHAYMPLNIIHPWNPPRAMAPQLLRFLLYQPALALFGYPLMRYTSVVSKAIGSSFVDRDAITPEEIAWFSERFRAPVCARAGTDSYRTFWRYELRAGSREPERRRSTVPTLALFGASDKALRHSLAAAETANADEYQLELVYACGHFIAEEKPALVRRRLEDLAARFT